MNFSILITLLLFLITSASCAQDSITTKTTKKDVIDVAGTILKSNWLITRDTVPKKPGRVYFSGAPSIGYSLTSRWAAIFVGNFAFFTSEIKKQKISLVYLDVLYTQNQQFIWRIQSNVWTKDNRFNLVTDWRYYFYPQKTYGLGGNSEVNAFVDQTFSYVRFHQTILTSLRPNFYAGIGVAWDRHYNVVQGEGNTEVINQINAYDSATKTTSAGLLFNLLYDSRINSINPWGGLYANVIYRPNFTSLSSDSPWQLLSVDLRKYISFPHLSENILALWSYNWFTLNGDPPYLDLPSTGWDSYSNTGRGYIQGRFRSKNLIYTEAEYRFKIMRNGLLGGVVFTNAQSVTDWPNNTFNSIAFGAGAGMRIKFNKYSRTNICIDYAFGQGGSQGVFVNLGEVF